MKSVVLRFAGSGRRVDVEREVGTEFRIVQRRGIATRPVRDQAQFDPGQPVTGILDVPGEWWALCRDDAGRFLILADPFSLQPLFYAAVWTPQGSDLLVGPQVDATAQAIGTTGAKVETDWAGVLPSLLANHDFFDTAHDVLTPVRRLLMTRPDQAILVEDGGYRLVPRPSRVRGEPTYEGLLRAGADRAVAEIGATLDLAGPGGAVLNLSGGKDSRLVLALIMAGGFGHRLRIHSVDPRGDHPAWRTRILREDLEISSQLLQRFGLQWAGRPSERQVWPDTLDGQLFAFQHYRGGRSYQFMPNGRAYCVPGLDVRFTGAGAGALKSPWASEWQGRRFWHSLGHAPDTLRTDALRVYRAVGMPAGLPATIDTRAVNRFASTMRSISTDGTIDGGVEAHYRAFRNRGHVGGLAWGRSMGIINCKPLLQPEFFAAAQLLSAEERRDGRVMFDLIELLHPGLNDLPFQSGNWPWPLRRSPREDWSRWAPDPASYFAVRDAVSATPGPPLPPARRPDMLPLLRSGLDQFEQALQDAGHPVPERLTRIQEEPPADRRGQGRLLTKLATWAHSMPDPGVFARSANPQAPRVVTMTPETTAQVTP